MLRKKIKIHKLNKVDKFISKWFELNETCLIENNEYFQTSVKFR